MATNHPDGAPAFDWMLPLALDPAGFRRWLWEGDWDHICGWADNPVDCPLARYLNRSDAPLRYVRPDKITLHDSDDWVCDLPPWAQQFVGAVDRHQGPIRFGRARALLDDALAALDIAVPRE